MHPTIVRSAIPMALCMEGWNLDDGAAVAPYRVKGVRLVADADFSVCPDNTAHLVPERITRDLPLPGWHIAEVLCRKVVREHSRPEGPEEAPDPIPRRLLRRPARRRLEPPTTIGAAPSSRQSFNAPLNALIRGEVARTRPPLPRSRFSEPQTGTLALACDAFRRAA
jgi:hypothetical protein